MLIIFFHLNIYFKLLRIILREKLILTRFKRELIPTMKHVQIERQKKMIQKRQIKFLLVSQKF